MCSLLEELYTTLNNRLRKKLHNHLGHRHLHLTKYFGKLDMSDPMISGSFAVKKLRQPETGGVKGGTFAVERLITCFACRATSQMCPSPAGRETLTMPS